MSYTLTPCPKPVEPEIWVDEAIWGHRLYNEQTPWMTLLEFANILRCNHLQGKAFVESEPNTLKYTSRTALYLRNILFNNPRMQLILDEASNENDRWLNWLEEMERNSTGIALNPDYSYLRKRFSEFEHLYRAVEFLRRTAIEGNSNKRWSSKFVFPYGPDCLYEDLNVDTSGRYSNDRRFFARTGELLYLMLTRSGYGPELLDHLRPLLLEPDKKWNRLVAALQPADDSGTVGDNRSSPFLPHHGRIEYSGLAEDWLNILRCRMPGYDALSHITNLTGLHLVIYFLHESLRVLGEALPAWFVLEIVSPKKNVVRSLATDAYDRNDGLSRRAVEKHIEHITQTADWSMAKHSDDPVENCKLVLRGYYAWPQQKAQDDEIAGVASPDELLDKLRVKAVSRHKQHVEKFHSTWCKQIGLSSRRGTRRARYAPTDSLLKTLVMATVRTRMEFREFLGELYRKYGFVIGEHQAREMIAAGDADQKAFVENAARLEQRLGSIGLLKRLSDACAYVENPFSWS